MNLFYNKIFCFEYYLNLIDFNCLDMTEIRIYSFFIQLFL